MNTLSIAECLYQALATSLRGPRIWTSNNKNIHSIVQHKNIIHALVWCNRLKRLTNTSWNTSSKVNFRVAKVASHGNFQMIWTSQYGDFAAKKSCATPVQLCCAMVPSQGKHQLPKHLSYKSKLPKNLVAILEVHEELRFNFFSFWNFPRPSQSLSPPLAIFWAH